jgi:hypothetical protein
MADEKPKQEIVKVPIEINGHGLMLKTIDDMYRWANALVKSGIVPKGFETPEKVMVALQAGAELGLTPQRSLNSFYIVNGKPTLYGDTPKMLVLASGQCEKYREWTDGTGDAMAGHCLTRRKGYDQDNETTFTVAQAKRAGLWGKTGPWTQYPDRMLIMRARTYNLRDNFPDVLGGFNTTEEMNGPTPEYEPTTPPRAERKPVENTAPAKDPRERIDGLYSSFREAVCNYNNGLPDEKVMEIYLQWVSFQFPGTTAADWKDPARWTEDTLSALELSILSPIPRPVLDLIPAPEPATIPEGGKDELF